MTLDSLYFWLTVFTLLVVVGVILEGEEILSELRAQGWKKSEHKVAKIGFALLVIGLAGELFFQTRIESADAKLKRESDIKIADMQKEASRLSAEAESARAEIAGANARALEAQVALEKFKAPRSLNSEQREKLVADLARYAGQQFSGIVAGGVPDASKFWSELVAMLTAAKWQLLPPAGDAAGDPPAGIPITPSVGVIVAIPVGEEQTSGPPAMALAAELSSAGIAATAVRNASPQNRSGVIVIVIGTKP